MIKLEIYERKERLFLNAVYEADTLISAMEGRAKQYKELREQLLEKLGPDPHSAKVYSVNVIKFMFVAEFASKMYTAI